MCRPLILLLWSFLRRGRHTGKQLFERDRNLDKEEESFVEEGVESVDLKQYDRTAREEDEEEEEDTGIRFEDSD